MIKWSLIVLWFASITYMDFRGKVRVSFLRTVLDHSAVLAPVNVFMYLFSAVPARPYIPADHLKGLDALDQNWENIRDEAMHTHQAQQIRAADANTDAASTSFFNTGWPRFTINLYEPK